MTEEFFQTHKKDKKHKKRNLSTPALAGGSLDQQMKPDPAKAGYSKEGTQFLSWLSTL